MSKSNIIWLNEKQRVILPPPPTPAPGPVPWVNDIPLPPRWHAWAWGLVGFVMTILACLLAVSLAGCGGSQAPVQTAQKVAITKAAQTCDDKAVAIIEAGETCEGIVRALNKLSAGDPACARVIHVADPVKSCEGIGVQGKVSK